MRIIFLLLLSGMLANARQISLLDFEGGNAGEVITIPKLNYSVRGAPMSFDFQNGFTGMTNDTFGQRPLVGWQEIPGYGIYNGAGATGLKCDLSLKGFYINATPRTPSLSASVGFWFYTDVAYTNTGVNWDVVAIFSASGIFANCDFQSNDSHTAFKVTLEDLSGTLKTVDGLTNDWYWINVGFQVCGGVSNGIAVYDKTGTNLVGMVTTSYATTNLARWYHFGNSSSTVGTGYPTNSYWQDSILSDFSGTNTVWPMLPGNPHGLPVLAIGNLSVGTATNSP